MLMQAKQINKLLQAMVGVMGFTTGTANNDTITSALSTALSTAGVGNTAVPLQVGNETTEGVNVTATRVPIFIGGTKDKAQDANGNDVFAVLSQSSGAYKLTYYSNVAGTDTAYTWATATAIDFDIQYYFTFNDLPSNALVGPTQRHVAPDPSIAGDRTYMEQLTVTATNTLSNTTKTPAGNFIEYNVNGQKIPAGSSTGIAMSAAGASTVTAATLGYSILTTDTVFVTYSW